MKKLNIKNLVTILALIFLLTLAACSGDADNDEAVIEDPNSLSVDDIKEKAEEEGAIDSIAMPDSWANWEETWEDLSEEYSLKHTDTNMDSAEELAKFEAEGKDATADIGDVGVSFGPIAAEKGLTMPYKTSYWDEIPDWAKDDEGHWVVAYQGTIAFITNKKLVDDPPESWADILEGDYKVSVGDVQSATQAQMAVVSAALAHGGDESDLAPGVDYYSEIAKQGRLVLVNPNLPQFESGEVEVGIVWDFNALNYAELVGSEDFDITVPEEGSVVSGYSTIINKFAPHPHAALLTREYILSDEGQNNLAKGHARPIREDVELTKEAEDSLLPPEEYENTIPIEDYGVLDDSVSELMSLWQEEVLTYVN